MKIRQIKKLFSNKIASLRDYEVKEYINSKGVILKRNNESMTLTVEDLYKGFQCHGKFCKSKIPSFRNPISGLNGYLLIDFVWEPDKKEN